MSSEWDSSKAMNAYESFYLPDAKSHLGVCTDYLVNCCGIAADRVGGVYATSPEMKAFARGEPAVVSGISGIELGQRLYRALYNREDAPDWTGDRTGRSREYWGGWALAHFQWHWNVTFRWIFARTSLSDLLAKYAVYHEADISRFLEDFMDELKEIPVEPNLRRIRRATGYSQAELARMSGVNVRNIQLYEQRAQDINRAAASTLAALARCLSCAIEDLME